MLALRGAHPHCGIAFYEFNVFETGSHAVRNIFDGQVLVEIDELLAIGMGDDRIAVSDPTPAAATRGRATRADEASRCGAVRHCGLEFKTMIGRPRHPRAFR